MATCSRHIISARISRWLPPLCLTILFFWSSYQAAGQSPKLQEWLAIWRDDTQADTSRLKALHNIVRKGYLTAQPDSAFYFADRQEEFARQIGHKEWQVKALENKANIMKRSGTYTEALQYYDELLPLQEEVGDRNGLAVTYREIGYTLRKQGQFGKALEHFQQSLRLAEQLGEEGRLATAAVLNAMGSLYLDQADYEKALEHYEKCLALCLILERRKDIAASYNNIGLVYYHLEKYDDALEYLNKSLVIKQELDDEEGIANVYHNFGHINLKTHRPEAATIDFERAYQLTKSLNLKADIAAACYGLGLAALELGQYPAARQWCEEGVTIARSIGNLEEEAYNCECLYKAYKNLGEPALALAKHERLLALKDSLFNAETTRRLTRLETQYGYEQEKAVMTSQLQYQSLLRNISIAVALLLALLSTLALLANRARRRKNIELEKKNDQIVKDRQIIEQQALDLQRANDMRSRFFTNISHELRTPVTLIGTPVEQLLREHYEELSPNALRMLDLAQNNTKKLNALVEEILELSKLESGKVELQLGPVGLSTFARRLFSAFESRATQKHIHYHFSSTLSPEAHYLLDRARLAKIINNLLSNALKFTSEGGSVQLAVGGIHRSLASRQDPTDRGQEGDKQGADDKHGQQQPDAGPPLQTANCLLFTVSDTGRGIPSEDLPYVFERYFQTSRASLPTEGGTGIGLAMARELARLMGGELSVESEWGRGSTFRLLLPAVEQPTGEAPVEEPAMITPADTISAKLAPGDADRPTILVVEDNQDMQTLLVSLLEARYNCRLADHGAAAWALLQQAHDIQLIISDVMMPEMDGYTLLEHIKETPGLQQLPVIMLTARTAEHDKLKALRLGVDDYLGKPFSAEELLARAGNLIDRYQLRRDFQREMEEEPSPPSADQQWLAELEAAVDEAINKKIELSIPHLTEIANLGDRQLLRRLKSLTGLTTQQYIQEIKLQRARRLLENRSFLTIAEVAYDSGFNTPAYFTKVYEQRFGKRPAEYFEALA